MCYEFFKRWIEYAFKKFWNKNSSKKKSSCEPSNEKDKFWMLCLISILFYFINFKVKIYTNVSNPNQDLLVFESWEFKFYKMTQSECVK